MALEAMPLQWFDKLSSRSIKGWEDLQRAFCENFAGIIMHPITHAELEGLKQKEKKISETTIDGLVSYALKFMTSLNEKSLRPSPLGF
jgi:hypothetical protein